MVFMELNKLFFKTMSKVVLITGATRGIGRAIALRFASEGADIAFTYRSQHEAAQTLTAELEALGVKAKAYSSDAASFADAHTVVEDVKTVFGRIDILINNAGTGAVAPAEDITDDQFANEMNIDLFGSFKMAREVAKQAMIPAKYGRIINIASVAAYQPIPYIDVYGASKAFVLSYSRAMNRELKAKGIRVMAMNPGWVKTEFFNHALLTNGNEVQYYNYLWEAKDVVATGLKDLYKTKKDYSVHGLPIRNQVRLVKLVPHSIVMNIWLNQQKKAKNNKGLTTK